MARRENWKNFAGEVKVFKGENEPGNAKPRAAKQISEDSLHDNDDEQRTRFGKTHENKRL
jgi:hypothetical protein